jgi:aspartate aminotransferase-like enzyme
MVEDGRTSAYEIFEILERDYGIWVCPSGGELKDKLFRVGHLGALDTKDMDVLLEALGKIV